MKYCKYEILKMWNFVNVKFCKYEILWIWNFVSIKFCKCEILWIWILCNMKLWVTEIFCNLIYQFQNCALLEFLMETFWVDNLNIMGFSWNFIFVLSHSDSTAKLAIFALLCFLLTYEWAQ